MMGQRIIRDIWTWCNNQDIKNLFSDICQVQLFKIERLIKIPRFRFRG